MSGLFFGSGRGGKRGGGKGVRTLFSGLAEEESAPSSSFTAHSGTALRTPQGELTLRGTRVYSSTTTLDTDQSNPKKSPDTNGTVENNIVFSRAFFQ